jgi:hypothetical protein
VYQTKVDGTHHELGTSGFLYRSNKIMYDHETKSMWSTLQGVPVVGPLVGKGIKLKRRHVVTTNWGEWKRRHPNTTVLSLNTGHRRDYGEGVAYKDYFSSHRLMFAVPEDDDRLQNKDEILAMRNEDHQLAISANFLAETPVHHDKLGDQEIVVLTDKTGANRAYDATGLKLKSWNQENRVVDSKGKQWTLTEAALVDSSGEKRTRLPAHRAFWFGWQTQFPKTRLVK